MTEQEWEEAFSAAVASGDTAALKRLAVCAPTVALRRKAIEALERANGNRAETAPVHQSKSKKPKKNSKPSTPGL